MTGGLRNLGTLGGSRSAAFAANNRGQVVGAALPAGDTEFRAFVWHAKEGMVDLNRRLCHPPAGLTLHSAIAISDNGAIVAASNAGLVLLRPAHAHASAPAAGASVGPIVANELVALGTPLNASVSVASEAPAASHKVSWSWGDGNTGPSLHTGAGKANFDFSRTGSHTYGAPGIYTVTANVADAAGKTVTVSRQVVVYDPSSASAAGTGAFLAPHWKGKAGMPYGGKARLSFLAPSSSSARVANARAGLQFDLGGLHFRSTDLRPVATSAAGRLFEGSGTINGTGRHKVRLEAVAPNGAPARLKLRIWHADPATGREAVDYESLGPAGSAAGVALTEGRIAMH
jgi:probable HAF family extracellular repeat protein